METGENLRYRMRRSFYALPPLGDCQKTPNGYGDGMASSIKGRMLG